MRPVLAVPLLAAAPLLLADCASRTPSGPAAPPEVGSPAPDFALPGSDGKTHSLAEHRGRRPVVVAWFPKAFTGG